MHFKEGERLTSFGCGSAALCPLRSVGLSRFRSLSRFRAEETPSPERN